MLLNINRHWYQSSLSWLTLLLLPFSFLFYCLISIRQWLYQKGLLKKFLFNIPVIVVGNISVGGTGKTPFVIWLSFFLHEMGFKPGIISRGVGGKINRTPHRVELSDKAEKVGDEPLLIARQTKFPVVVCQDKIKAVETLVKNYQCDVVISDDGLQHYRLNRTFEIAMVDGSRRFGNRRVLPAGPLREPVKRLESVDLTIVQDGTEKEWWMKLEPTEVIALRTEAKKTLKDFSDTTVHAVAGIGHPERFFKALKAAKLTIIPHIYPDHYVFQKKDLQFNDDLPIIMTEKDAVKYRDYANERHWYLQVMPVMPIAFPKVLRHLLISKGVTHAK